MSKCREAFEQWLCTTASQSPVDIWQAAWNARGKVDAEICRTEGFGSMEARNIYRAIEQEQCK